MKFADPMMLIRLAFVPVLLLAQFLKYNRFSVEIPSLADDPEEMTEKKEVLLCRLVML